MLAKENIETTENLKEKERKKKSRSLMTLQLRANHRLHFGISPSCYFRHLWSILVCTFHGHIQHTISDSAFFNLLNHIRLSPRTNDDS